MRVSTGMQYRSHLNYLQMANSRVDEASDRYNTGRKFQTAGQDPSGMASRIRYLGDISAYQQYSKNAGMVADTLSQEETALGQIWDSLSSVQTRLIQAINGTMDDGARKALAKDIEQVQAQIFDLMNTKNSEGEYIFSGAQSDKPTYVLQPDGTYKCQADGSNKFVNVSPTVKVQVTDSGLNIFENNQLANSISLGNGSGHDKLATPGFTIKDYDQFNTFFKDNYSFADGANNSFNIVITAVPDGKTTTETEFELRDANGKPLDPPQKGFVKDGKITVQGMEFSLAEGKDFELGDVINFELNEPQQDNILNQLSKIVDALETPQDEWGKNGSPVDSKEHLTSMLSAMQQNVENAKKQVDTYRGYVGARSANIEAIIRSDETLGDIKTEANANISEIDAFTAVSDLLLANNALQVAQQSYQVVHSTSLFDFI